MKSVRVLGGGQVDCVSQEEVFLPYALVMGALATRKHSFQCSVLCLLFPNLHAVSTLGRPFFVLDGRLCRALCNPLVACEYPC